MDVADQFLLIDDCKIVFDGPAPDLEYALYRQNGGTATISVQEVVEKTVTLSDGNEAVETFFTGRAMQIDRITEITVSPGRKDGEMVISGFSDQARKAGLEDEATAVSFRVIPGPRCSTCS